MHNLDQSEQTRRKDISQTGVAQEALDVLAALPEGASPSEVFTEHGYSLSHVLKPALAEEHRIVEELLVKPSKDVASDMLVVKDVQSKHEIAEFVAPEPVEIP